MSITNETQLSEQETKTRDFILNGSMFKVVLQIGLPIAFFQGINQLLRVVDSFMAASIDATAASMVTYFGQMNLIISGLGLGLAAGATLKISQVYGAGDFQKVKKQISSIFAFAVLFCLVMMVIIVPLSTPLMRWMNTPAEFIAQGRTYFLIEFAVTMIGIINVIYIALERVQGNTKKILNMNLIAMAINMGFTAFSVYILREGITFIAISSLISQLFIFAMATYNLSGRKSEVFKFSLKEVSLKRMILAPMLLISVPIMIERSAFHVGKTVVNVMITGLGPLVVGGLGISNLLCGIGVSPQMGFQDSTVAIMAQNKGAGSYKRVFEAFKAIFVINCVTAVLFFIPLFFFARQTTSLFAIGDPYFHDILYRVHIIDVWSVLFLGAYSAITALLFGLGFTRLTLLLNVCRIFLFRIPVLMFLQHFTTMGPESAGFVMAFSNIAVTALGLLIGALCIKKVCQEQGIKFWQKEELALEN